MSEQKFSAKKTIQKGVEPPAFIALWVSVGVGVLKLLNIDIDETTISTVLSVAVGCYGLYKSFINWKKNKSKQS